MIVHTREVKVIELQNGSCQIEDSELPEGCKIVYVGDVSISGNGAHCCTVKYIEAPCDHEWEEKHGMECSDRTCIKCGKHEPCFNYY